MFFDNQVFTKFKKAKYILQSAELNWLTSTRRHTHCPMGERAAPPPLPLQVKRPTQRGHMTQPLAFLPVLLCISGVHETLRHPPLLSLAHARLLVAVAESRACQEPCLGATWIDKMRMRARGWHMVLISSQVYRGLYPRNIIRPTPSIWTPEHNLAHIDSPMTPLFHPKKGIVFHHLKLLLYEEKLKLCLLHRGLLGSYKYAFDDFLVNRSFGINENEKQILRLALRDLVKCWWISVCTDK